MIDTTSKTKTEITILNCHSRFIYRYTISVAQFSASLSFEVQLYLHDYSHNNGTKHWCLTTVTSYVSPSTVLILSAHCHSWLTQHSPVPCAHLYHCQSSNKLLPQNTKGSNGFAPEALSEIQYAQCVELSGLKKK